MLTTETEIQLAPAAGSGIGKKLAAALLARPDFVGEMVGVIERGFSASRRYWDKDADCWEKEEDCKTQLQTLTLVLAHMEGEPIKRIIHQHLGAGGAIDPLAALQESPALLEQAERLIEKAKWRKSGRAKKAEPVKAEPAAPPDEVA